MITIQELDLFASVLTAAAKAAYAVGREDEKHGRPDGSARLDMNTPARKLELKKLLNGARKKR